MTYKKLFKLWRKAHPDIYTDQEPVYQPVTSDGSGPSFFRVYVDKEHVNYRGYEDFDAADKHGLEPSTYKTEEQFCKERLLKIMSNKSFQKYFKTITFDSLEELELKLAAMGFK